MGRAWPDISGFSNIPIQKSHSPDETKLFYFKDKKKMIALWIFGFEEE